MLGFGLLLASCSQAPPLKPAAGVAYAGPPALYLHSDLGTKSQTVATVTHGERLDVLEIRRRFVRVRTGAGVEGWTDTNQLLSDRQMAQLRLLASSTAQLPSEGAARVYDALNIHIEPYRQSPSFLQIPEGGTAEVIGHRRSPHSPPPQAPKPAVVHHAAVSKKARPKASPGAALRPAPAPPPPPAGWMDQAKPRPAAPAPVALAGSPAPPADDDWYLVRMPNGDTGWGLARLLVMAVPEDVAQYAEGHRVTAYLPLGEVVDKEKNETKQDWLWTTASPGLHPYDFDSFRVFVWSPKRHHYETAYIERNVKGYYPVETEALPGQEEKAFSLVLEDKDGKLYRQTFAFNGYHIRMASKVPYQPPPPLPEVEASTGFEAESGPAPAPQSSWTSEIQNWWKRIRKN